MPKHVLAFVEWNEFRRGGRTSRPERSFFYALAVPHLHERVGNGGTLWVITRRPGTRRYSLAYKLVNCRVQNDVPVYIQQCERGQVCSWLLSSCRGRCRQIDLPPTHGEARKGKGAVTAIISHLAETPMAVWQSA
jgi:hypothetical protein